MQVILENVYSQLGVDEVAGERIQSEFDMDRLLRAGLPVLVLRGLREKWGFTVLELCSSLGIPKSTLMRMIEQGKRMSAVDSDRVYRLVSILALAEQAIGERKKAQLWLRQPNPALGRETPLRTLETEIGARMVEQVLGRIAYGGVS
jgi:putative toxin-antitoxin system antitoxin component (TIGR02293 family)